MKGGVIRANDVMEVIVHARHHTQEKILVKKFLIGMTQRGTHGTHCDHLAVGSVGSVGFNVLTFRCTKSISQLYCYIELSEG